VKSGRRLFALPLLAKELTERAARPRTYWMRLIAAVLLFMAFSVENKFIFREDNPSVLLGSGRGMLSDLAEFLFIGIYTFVPAMLCGVITHEKERDSLTLLMLTELRPWQIVLQKYLGGLIPAFTLLFLAMPLAGVAYAYGGFTIGQLGYTLLLLALACLQIGALAVWCSCWFRNTVGAFIGTYLTAAILLFGPILVRWLYVLVELRNRGFGTRPYDQLFERYLVIHVPPAVLDLAESGRTFGKLEFSILGPLIIAGTTVFFLCAAAYHLPRRAFVPAEHRLRRVFGWLDSIASRGNRLLGNVRWGRAASELPEKMPVLWREMRSRALARPEHLLRLLVFVEIPVVLIALPLMGQRYFDREAYGLSLFGAVGGILAVLALSATASNALVSERVNQTLEVLLTTPMSAAQIVREKARALRRFTIVLTIPLLTIFGFECVSESTRFSVEWWGGGQKPNRLWLYAICASLTVLVCLPLIGWLSLWIGMICKTRIRAIVATLGTILAWCVLPLIGMAMLNVDPSRHDPARYLTLLCPLLVPSMNELGSLDDFEPQAPWLPVLVNFALYGGILFFIRHHCLTRADHYLRR
jgi:ABC-type transport system involved in multi-copper enzyme maturation permease subunit